MRKNNLTEKVTKLLLCVVAVMSLSACGSKQAEIPNPFKECNNLGDAAAVAGFEMIAPDSLDGYEEKYITALENDMIQVQYQHEDNQVCIRKAAGEKDCSGDYNEYAQETKVTVGDRDVTLRGNDDRIMLAIWTEDSYSYSIGVYAYMQKDNGTATETTAGVTEEVMTDWIAQVQ